MSDQGVRIATTEAVASQRIVATIGFVTGLAVRTRGLSGNIMAGLHTLGGNGGEIDEYTATLAETRRRAIHEMAERARALGANAVIAVRFDTAEVGYEMSEIVAYGTAVVVEPMP